jgi:hypothetical protein
VILKGGPRDLSMLVSVRDERKMLVHVVGKDRIKATSIAAVRARNLEQKQQAR